MAARLDNLRLLLAEVLQEIDLVEVYLRKPSLKAQEDLKNKVACISTMAALVQNQSFDQARPHGFTGKEGRLLRGLSSIGSRLDRISDLAYNIVRQMSHLSSPQFLRPYDLEDFFADIRFGLSRLVPALEQEKLDLALRLCRTEETLDAHYAGRFARLIGEFGDSGKKPGDLVTTIMLVHYLERIGDLILEIGEQIIYIIIGEKLKYSQYQALGAGRRAAGLEANLAPGDFQSIWSGRSGCRIGVVTGGGEDHEDPMVFKHGPAGKVARERENLAFWSQLRPGLTPKVAAFLPGLPHEEAGLMLEYIPDATLKDLFMGEAPSAALDGLAGLLRVMEDIWLETMAAEPAADSFVSQAEKRLAGVRALHPQAVTFQGRLGSLAIEPLASLLQEARGLEKNLTAPFAVRIHGDFNLGNILFAPERGVYHFLDLHRSRMADYVQDLSVLILSIVRLPLESRRDRARLSAAARSVYGFAARFASDHGDPTMEARLAFGLARSYLTSARFELAEAKAHKFIAVSRYFWEKLIAHGRTGTPWPDFRLNADILS